jgi:hypothetical protein
MTPQSCKSSSVKNPFALGLSQGTCTLGRERFVCYDDFAVCSGGDCAGRNRAVLSPASDAFFARFSTTGLNGTYNVQVAPARRRAVIANPMR